MHTLLLLTETYAASLDDQHCESALAVPKFFQAFCMLSIRCYQYTTAFIPTAPGSCDNFVLTALNDLQSRLNFETQDHGEKNHCEAPMQ